MKGYGKLLNSRQSDVLVAAAEGLILLVRPEEYLRGCSLANPGNFHRARILPDRPRVMSSQRQAIADGVLGTIRIEPDHVAVGASVREQGEVGAIPEQQGPLPPVTVHSLC